MKKRLQLLFVFCVLMITTRCGSDEVACSSGADCASGICTANGNCVSADGDSGLNFGGDGTITADFTGLADAEPGGTGNSDAGNATEDADQVTPRVDLDSPSVCSPNSDGRIDRIEVPIQAGLHATYRVAQNTAIDTAGDLQPDGSRKWSLSNPLNADHDVLVEAQPIDDKWFAEAFPGATYAAKLSESNDLLGVFEATDTALLLRGVVSPTDGLLRTELTYDPPAILLNFPVETGSSFESTSTVTGLTTGVVSLYTETYQSIVDASGSLSTPYADFDVLRVRVELTRVVGVVPTITRSFLFVAECFGTVATIRSNMNEPQDEFLVAAEVRRLAP